jgi:hypothetical protein
LPYSLELAGVIDMQIENTNFRHEDVHAHGLSMMVGLDTQPIRDIEVGNAWRNGLEL